MAFFGDSGSVFAASGHPGQHENVWHPHTSAAAEVGRLGLRHGKAGRFYCFSSKENDRELNPDYTVPHHP